MEQVRSDVAVAVRVVAWMATQQLPPATVDALDALCSTARVQLPAWGERQRVVFDGA